jgi:hypothetical protein
VIVRNPATHVEAFEERRDRGESAGDRRIALGLFLLTFVAYAWFFGGGGWNQNAHFDLTRALVERQTLYIDGYHLNTGDVSWVRQGSATHVYANKPPGVSVLAAIPYAVVYAIERALGIPFDSWQWLTINAWIVTVLSCGLTGALIPVVLYRYGRRHASPLAALGVALVVAFGTIVFPYATMLFAHVPSAFFLLLAFVWLDERPSLAGVAAGIAGTCYYLCIPAALVLLIGARRNALRFALGGLPFGVLLAIYQLVCFGSPFRTSVETSRSFTQEGLLLGVFGAPSLRALWGLTFSDYRGFFFVSPVLLLSFAGAYVMLRRRLLRRELVMIAVISAMYFFVVSSFNGWGGGWAFGPRYLTPIIPLFAIPLLFVRMRLAAIVLGTLSIVLQLMATAIDPTPPSKIQHPIRDFYLRATAVSINPQSIDELAPFRTYPPGSRASEWATFNLGELFFGAGSFASVLPIVLWIAGGAAWLAHHANLQQRMRTLEERQ